MSRRLHGFQVSFVDLKPIPGDAKPLSPEAFAVLVGVLVASRRLDADTLVAAVDDVDVATKVGAGVVCMALCVFLEVCGCMLTCVQCGRAYNEPAV